MHSVGKIKKNKKQNQVDHMLRNQQLHLKISCWGKKKMSMTVSLMVMALIVFV